MAEKGVIVEYDFTVLDGAKILYDTTGRFLKELDGVGFGIPSESRHLQETSTVYGAVPWQSWRRACAHNHLSRGSALAVTGSGDGVRSALLAGMGSVVVENDHVAYHDFGGADAVVKSLDSSAARKMLKLLRA